MTQKIYCCGCSKKVTAILTNGREVYPHRPDLSEIPFWKCETCGNYVGCHHKTANPTQPLGNIPTQEIRSARRRIHCILDPIWKSGAMTRREVYARVSTAIGYPYHSGEIKTLEEANKIQKILEDLAQ